MIALKKSSHANINKEPTCPFKFHKQQIPKRKKTRFPVASFLNRILFVRIKMKRKTLQLNE